MGRTDYFVIGALLASAVIAIAIAYICKVFESFSEAKSDEEIWRPIRRYDDGKDGTYPVAELTGEDSTRVGETENKQRDG